MENKDSSNQGKQIHLETTVSTTLEKEIPVLTRKENIIRRNE